MSPRKRGEPGPFCVAHDTVSRLPARSSHALWHDRRHGLAHAGETGNAARSQGLCQRQVQHREMRGPKSVRHDTRKRGPDFMNFDEPIHRAL